MRQGVINDHFNLQAAFVSMGVLALCSRLVSVVFLPPVSSEKITEKNIPSMTMRDLLKDRIVAGLFIMRFSYVMCIGIVWCFLPLFVDREFGFSSSKTGFIVMLIVSISGLLQVPMGYLADRVNKKYMIVTGALMVVYAICSYAWAEGFRDVVTAGIIFGIGGGITTPPVMAIAVIKGNETKSMGSVMGLLTMGHSLGMLAGSLLAGIAIDFFSMRDAFPIGAGIMSAGILCFLVCMYGKQVHSQNS